MDPTELQLFPESKLGSITIDPRTFATRTTYVFSPKVHIMYIPEYERVRVENVQMANDKLTKVIQPYANSLGYCSSLRLLTIVTLKSFYLLLLSTDLFTKCYVVQTITCVVAFIQDHFFRSQPKPTLISCLCVYYVYIIQMRSHDHHWLNLHQEYPSMYVSTPSLLDDVVAFNALD